MFVDGAYSECSGLHAVIVVVLCQVEQTLGSSVYQQKRFAFEGVPLTPLVHVDLRTLFAIVCTIVLVVVCMVCLH